MRSRVALRSALAAALIVSMVVAAVPGSSDEGADAVTHVHIQNIAYNAQTVTILAGETVEWDNHDPQPHTVSADDLGFDSGNLLNGDVFTHTFSQPGVYDYHCNIHAGQVGTVVVVNPAALPDLVVSGLSDTDAVPGVQKQIDVTVRNLGDSPAGPSVTLVTYASNGEDHVIGTLDVPTLLAGESFTGSVEWVTLGKVGDFVVTAHANPDGSLPESDPTNNVADATVSVLVSGFEGVDPLSA